jgi:DnaJ-class molecular chaperone
MAKDPYEILGVVKNASEADIKAAYRKLAKKHHPDINPDKKDDSKFKEIGAAYNLLSDKDKRAAYDRGEIDMEGQPRQQQFYRDHAQGPQGQRYYHPGNGHAGMGGDFDAADLEGLFGSFFRGGGRGQGFSPPPENANYTIEINFLEAALGGSKRITMPDDRTLDINIPEGIEDGQKLRLKGQGAKNPQGQAGDAYVEVHIRPHPQFTRKGQDVQTEVPVGFHESILGSKIEVPTIHGPVEVTIPKGASSGTILRLKGKGIKKGDQFVKLKIVMPAKIDDELEDTIKKWTEKHGYNPRKQKEAV